MFSTDKSIYDIKIPIDINTIYCKPSSSPKNIDETQFKNIIYNHFRQLNTIYYNSDVVGLYTDEFGSKIEKKSNYLSGGKDIILNNCYNYILNAVLGVKLHILQYFTDENCKMYMKDKQRLHNLLSIIHNLCLDALYDYGTACGTLSGESIQEPFTQFSLNAIHLSKEVSTAIERKKGLERITSELLGFKSPDNCLFEANMFIYLKPNISKEKIKQIADNIQCVRLSNLLIKCEIMLETLNMNICYNKYRNDKEYFVDSFIEHFKIKKNNNYHICFRLELNK